MTVVTATSRASRLTVKPRQCMAPSLLPWAAMRRRWWAVAAVVVVAAAGGGIFVATRSTKKSQQPASPPETAASAPDQTISTYLEDWGKDDWTGMAALVDQPPLNFASYHQSVLTDLQVTAASYTLVPPIQQTGDQAVATFAAHLQLRGLGEWDYNNKLSLNRQGTDWRVSWSPQAIFPNLALDRHFTRTRTVPARAAILARDGTPLTSETAIVSIGIEPSHIQNKATVVSTLVRVLGANANQINAALSAPG